MIKNFLLALFALTLLVAFGGTLYYLYEKSQEEPLVWSTNTPFTADITRKTVATGSVVPRREIDVKPRVSGIISDVYVEPGEMVAEGDLIARVTIVPDMISLSNAENRLNRARIDLANAEREQVRHRELFEQGVISEAAYIVYDTDLERGREELQASEDNLALIREGARKKAKFTTNTLVKATASGMVLEAPVERGDSVIEANTFNDGTTIATVANMDEMIFEGKVDESEVGKLKEGMELLLTVGAIEIERFKAELEYISPKGIEEEGAIQFEIRATIELKKDIFIRANYSANADIVLDRREKVLAIQESWLQFGDDGKPFVEVETSSEQYEKREIVTGLSDGITIEIVSGLSEDDRVKDPNSASA